MSNEKIYTIRITEAMNEGCGCPLCNVEQKLQSDELERILGAAMMEPNVRIETNAQGFCDAHLDKLSDMPNKLSLALMLKTHMDELNKKLYSDTVPLLKKKPDGKKLAAALDKKRRSCYLCSRINEFMGATYGAFSFMFKSDGEFEKRMRAQPYYCLKHTRLLLEAGARELGKEQYRLFSEAITDVNSAYAEQLSGDIDWFCKKFDYRYKDEDWKNSKDAVQRAVKYLK